MNESSPYSASSKGSKCQQTRTQWALLYCMLDVTSLRYMATSSSKAYTPCWLVSPFLSSWKAQAKLKLTLHAARLSNWDTCFDRLLRSESASKNMPVAVDAAAEPPNIPGKAFWTADLEDWSPEIGQQVAVCLLGPFESSLWSETPRTWKTWAHWGSSPRS